MGGVGADRDTRDPLRSRRCSEHPFLQCRDPEPLGPDLAYDTWPYPGSIDTMLYFGDQPVRQRVRGQVVYELRIDSLAVPCAAHHDL